MSDIASKLEALIESDRKHCRVVEVDGVEWMEDRSSNTYTRYDKESGKVIEKTHLEFLIEHQKKNNK